MDFYKNGGKMQWYNDDIEQERRNEKSAHQFHRKLSKPKYYPNLTFYCIEYQ